MSHRSDTRHARMRNLVHDARQILAELESSGDVAAGHLQRIETAIDQIDAVLDRVSPSSGRSPAPAGIPSPRSYNPSGGAARASYAMSQARRQELLGCTAFGQAALKQQSTHVFRVDPQGRPVGPALS